MMSELGTLHSTNGSAKKAVTYLRQAIAARGESVTIAQGEDRLRLVQALWSLSDRKAAASEETSLTTLIDQLDDSKALEDALESWRRER